MPDADALFVLVARGEVELDGVGSIRAGDTVELDARGGTPIRARSNAEVLIWELGR